METFLDEIWGVSHYQINRNCPDYFDRLLHGPSTVEKLLELYRPESSAVRLVRGEDKRGTDAYLLAGGSLDLARVRNDFDDGYTIVFDDVARYVRAIASLTQSVEVERNFATKVNAYATPPGSQGFLAHYDEHDVVIAQIQMSVTDRGRSVALGQWPASGLGRSFSGAMTVVRPRQPAVDRSEHTRCGPARSPRAPVRHGFAVRNQWS